MPIHFPHTHAIALYGRSEVGEEEVVDEEDAVYYETLFFLGGSVGEGDAVLVVFGGVFSQSIEEVNNFPNQRIAHQPLSLHRFVLHVGGSGLLLDGHPQDLVFDGVESPPGQNHEVAALWVPADYSEYGVACVIGDFELLVEVGVAAAVEDGLLGDSAHEAVLVFDVHGGPVFGTETAVVVADAFVGSVLVVVEACNAPGAMGGGEQESLEEADFFLESEVDVALFAVVFVGGDEFVLVGQVAGHEWESDGEGEGEGVVAIFERVWFLVEDEMAVLLEAAPVEYHQSIYNQMR